MASDTGVRDHACSSGATGDEALNYVAGMLLELQRIAAAHGARKLAAALALAYAEADRAADGLGPPPLQDDRQAIRDTS